MNFLYVEEKCALCVHDLFCDPVLFSVDCTGDELKLAVLENYECFK